MRYRFIDTAKGDYPLYLLCRVMRVANSAYHAYRSGKTHVLSAAKAELSTQVEAVFYQHRRRARRTAHPSGTSRTRHAHRTFSGSFTAELLEDGVFEDTPQARSETFSYIEGYYNRVRRHSSLGYKTPDEFEREWHINNNQKGSGSEMVVSGKT